MVDIPLLGGEDLSGQAAWNLIVEMGISDDPVRHPCWRDKRQ
jgi:hypothetical protein